MSDLQHLPKKRSLVLMDWFTLMHEADTATSPYDVTWDAVMFEENVINFSTQAAPLANYVFNEYWNREDPTKIYVRGFRYIKFIGKITFSPPTDSTVVSFDLIRHNSTASEISNQSNFPGGVYHSFDRSSAGSTPHFTFSSGFIPVNENDYFIFRLTENGTGDGSTVGTGGGALPETATWLQVELYDYL